MFSKIILNANIIDGTGAQPFKGDIAIEKDTIVQIGNLKNAKAQITINAEGLYASPGFIDIQNHSDVYWTMFDNPGSDSLVAQGITTALIGNCGASLAPLLTPDALLSIQKWHNLSGINLNWVSFSEYFKELSKRRFGVNFASLVGYSTLRRGLVKNEIRSLAPIELRTLVKALKESLDAGAFGLSSGLSYAHEAIIKEPELLEISNVVKEYDSLFSMHLRSESDEIVESISEAMALANKTGVNFKISHLKIRNKQNWHLFDDAVNLIEAAYQKNGNVSFDVYPYDFVWQVLYPYLPKWAYEGGREVMLGYLKDAEKRKKILDYLVTRKNDYSNIFIASTAMPLNVIGRTLGEIAARQGVSSEQAILNILEHGGSDILVFDKNLDMAQVHALLRHPLSVIGTDGAGFSINTRDNLVHPRCFGSMPKFLELAVQERLMPLEKAVQKITETPAKKIGLRKRGRIAVDYFADIVVFSPQIRSTANEANPYQYAHGVEHVLVNGEFALQSGAIGAGLHGKILKK